MTHPKLTPRLVVRDAASAIRFYTQAFGAEERERFAMPEGPIVHAAIAIDGAVVALKDASHGDVGPDALGGTPVILQLLCDDPDAVCERAVALGAEVVFPIEDQFYGHREGRIRDPFGHLWILTRVVREMTPAEIQRAVDAFGRDG